MRDFRGARPGPGKIQSIPARTQLAQGDSLLHRTFRRRQVTQLRGFRRGDTKVVVEGGTAEAVGDVGVGTLVEVDGCVIAGFAGLEVAAPLIVELDAVR